MKAPYSLFAFFICAVYIADSQVNLTLEQCLARARERSPQVKSAENAIQAAELARVELTTTKLPQLKLGASSIYAPTSGHFGYDPVLSNGGQVSGQIFLQQSVYDGGIRGLKTDQLSVDIDRSSKGKKIAERDLTFYVKQTFFESLRAQQEMNLQGESVHQLREYLDLIRRLSKGGNAPSTDVLKTELQLSNARLAFQKADEEYTLAKFSLAELIGSPLDTAFTLVGSLTDSTSLSILEQSDSANLEVSIAELVVKHSLLDIELAQKEKYPSILFIGDAGLLTSGDNLRLPQSERSGMIGYSLGFLVEFPLINWGATAARIQQKQLDADNDRLNMEFLHRSFLTESKKAQWQLSKLRQRLVELRQTLHAAEDNYFLTLSKYAGGGTLALEVLSAQQLLTDTKLSELQTQADIQLLLAKLEQLYAH